MDRLLLLEDPLDLGIFSTVDGHALFQRLLQDLTNDVTLALLPLFSSLRFVSVALCCCQNWGVLRSLRQAYSDRQQTDLSFAWAPPFVPLRPLIGPRESASSGGGGGGAGKSR